VKHFGFGPLEIVKVLGVVFMASYSFQKLRDPMRWMFLDNVNLIFHEAGHPIFSFFGEFMMFLGGSLMQLLVPIVFTIYFWRSGQRFAAMVTTFWLATSFVNLEVYIGDARSMELPLLGGDNSTHDWNWLLGEVNLLRQDKAIAGFVYVLGLISAVVSVGGGLYFARGDTPMAFSANTPISKLKNMGPKSVTMLEKIGIHTREELEEIGAIEAYKKLKLAGETPGHSFVYAIEGALLNKPWDALPAEKRFQLKAMIEHADTVLEARGIARSKVGGVE
jgi:TfoX C-terminal domain